MATGAKPGRSLAMPSNSELTPRQSLPTPFEPCVICEHPTLVRCYAAHAVCARCSAEHLREVHSDEVVLALAMCA